MSVCTGVSPLRISRYSSQFIFECYLTFVFRVFNFLVRQYNTLHVTILSRRFRWEYEWQDDFNNCTSYSEIKKRRRTKCDSFDITMCFYLIHFSQLLEWKTWIEQKNEKCKKKRYNLENVSLYDLMQKKVYNNSRKKHDSTTNSWIDNKIMKKNWIELNSIHSYCFLFCSKCLFILFRILYDSFVRSFVHCLPSDSPIAECFAVFLIHCLHLLKSNISFSCAFQWNCIFWSS